jgi:hypothetical protein
MCKLCRGNSIPEGNSAEARLDGFVEKKKKSSKNDRQEMEKKSSGK